MAMVNMMRDAKERKESEAMEYQEPDYPYGLCVRLGKAELEKLGITTLPAVGTEMMVMAKGYVKSVSSYEYEGEDKDMSLEVQLTDVEVGSASTGGDAASALYGA